MAMAMAMASILNLLFALFFISLLRQGNCQCSIDNLKINQSATGKTVQDKPEWEVRIKNNCPCTQSDVKLKCVGFQTVEGIDSSVLAKSGGECLINGGQPVAPSSAITFKYAWNSSFAFAPLSSQPNCS